MQLRRGDVLDGAMAILDEFGLPDLTMRRLATALGVQPGALYWHFPNKQTLLGALADKILEDVDAPVTAPRLGRGVHRTGPPAPHRTARPPRRRRTGLRHVCVPHDQLPGPGKLRRSRSAIRTVPRTRGTVVLLAAVLRPRPHGRRAVAGADGVGRRPHPGGPLPPTPPQSPPIAAYDEDLLAGDPAVRFDFGLSLFVDGIRARLKDSAHRP